MNIHRLTKVGWPPEGVPEKSGSQFSKFPLSNIFSITATGFIFRTFILLLGLFLLAKLQFNISSSF
jgi:hypothetical protein